MMGSAEKGILVYSGTPPGFKYVGFVHKTIVKTVPAGVELLHLFENMKRKEKTLGAFIDKLINEAIREIEDYVKDKGANVVANVRYHIFYLGWGRIGVTVYGDIGVVENEGSG